MIQAKWRDHASAIELAEAVACRVGAIIERALDQRGQALVALPGGTTPLPVYDKLAESKLSWMDVTIIPTDDRLVPTTDPLSNAAMLITAFIPVGARVWPITIGRAMDYRLAGVAASARLLGLPWPPDLVWLGMGADGHTASIFPGPDLQAALSAPPGCRAVGVLPDPLPPEAPVARVTLTRAAITSARTLIVTITGEDKRRVLERALKDGDASPFPIGRVLAASDAALDIHWSPA